LSIKKDPRKKDLRFLGPQHAGFERKLEYFADELGSA
jgi:hypothetical protein